MSFFNIFPDTKQAAVMDDDVYNAFLRGLNPAAKPGPKVQPLALNPSELGADNKISIAVPSTEPLPPIAVPSAEPLPDPDPGDGSSPVEAEEPDENFPIVPYTRNVASELYDGRITGLDFNNPAGNYILRGKKLLLLTDGTVGSKSWLDKLFDTIDILANYADLITKLTKIVNAAMTIYNAIGPTVQWIKGHFTKEGIYARQATAFQAKAEQLQAANSYSACIASMYQYMYKSPPDREKKKCIILCELYMAYLVDVSLMEKGELRKNAVGIEYDRTSILAQYKLVIAKQGLSSADSMIRRVAAVQAAAIKDPKVLEEVLNYASDHAEELKNIFNYDTYGIFQMRFESQAGMSDHYASASYTGSGFEDDVKQVPSYKVDQKWLASIMRFEPRMIEAPPQELPSSPGEALAQMFGKLNEHLSFIFRHWKEEHGPREALKYLLGAISNDFSKMVTQGLLMTAPVSSEVMHTNKQVQEMREEMNQRWDALQQYLASVVPKPPQDEEASVVPKPSEDEEASVVSEPARKRSRNSIEPSMPRGAHYHPPGTRKIGHRRNPFMG